MSEERRADEPETLSIECTRSAQFRTMLVDGAWGGVRGDGLILMDVYSQNASAPVPEHLVVDPETGDATDGPSAGPQVLREYEARLVLTAPVAFELGLWLLEQSALADPTLGLTAPDVAQRETDA